MSGPAVGEEPASALPLPHGSRVVGEAVIEAEDLADDEEPLGALVGRAGDVLFHAGVDGQGTDLERDGIFVGCYPSDWVHSPKEVMWGFVAAAEGARGSQR